MPEDVLKIGMFENDYDCKIAVYDVCHLEEVC